MDNTKIRPLEERKRPVVKLVIFSMGEDIITLYTMRNVFIVMKIIVAAMKKADWTQPEINKTIDDMISKDYDHFIEVICDIFD